LGALGRPALARDVRVVPLGTTPSHFHPGTDPRPVRAKYGLDGGPWLLTVSRLDTHKGIDTVIRALPAVRAAFPTTRYAVAGVGARGPEFERLAAQLGLEDAVTFLGFVADAELPAPYNAASLYVGASRRYDLLAEGFGIALVEASASGLAVVGGDSAGVADAVRDGETGMLVDPEDAAAVAAGIVRLLGDDQLRARLGPGCGPLGLTLQGRLRRAITLLHHFPQVVEREHGDVLDARVQVVDRRQGPRAQPHLELRLHRQLGGAREHRREPVVLRVGAQRAGRRNVHGEDQLGVQGPGRAEGEVVHRRAVDVKAAADLVGWEVAR